MSVVAYVPTTYPVLSETFVSLEVAELRRQGAQVEVVAVYAGDAGGDVGRVDLLWRPPCSRPQLALAHARLALAHPRRYAEFLRVRRLLADPGMSWQHLPWWALDLRRRGVEVVHAHFAWSSASRAWGLSALLGVPWSVTVHASDIFAVREHLEEKLAAADAVVTVCTYNRDWLREELGLTRPIEIVVCGVEVPAPSDGSDLEGDDVLVVGRLVEKKGIDVLLRAVALWGDSRRDVRIRVIGDGPLREELHDLAGSLGVLDRVVFAGAVSHAETLTAIGRARILCLPCRVARNGDRDSMPLVIKEAMVRGVPVVASDAVGVPEMVDPSSGWLVPPDDPSALSAALAEALDDRDEATARGEAGRRRALEHFRLDVEVGRLRQVFDTLAAAGR